MSRAARHIAAIARSLAACATAASAPHSSIAVWAETLRKEPVAATAHLKETSNLSLRKICRAGFPRRFFVL